MANPFLVLGGVAVGVITAGIGVLAVPGWIDSAHDSAAMNDLGNIRGAESAAILQLGEYTEDWDVLKSGELGVKFQKSDTVTLIGLKADTNESWCASALSKSGKFFAASSDTARFAASPSGARAAMTAVGCDPDLVQEIIDEANNSGGPSVIGDDTATDGHYVGENPNAGGGAGGDDPSVPPAPLGAVSPIGQPWGVAYTAHGVYAVNTEGQILRSGDDGHAHAVTITGDAAGSRFHSVTRLDSDRRGNVYAKVDNTATGDRLHRIAPDGTSVDITPSFNNTGVGLDLHTNVIGFATNDAGTVYYAGAGAPTGSYDDVFDGWIGDGIWKLASGGQWQLVADLDDSLNAVNAIVGMDADDAGNVYLNLAGHGIHRVAPDGQVTTVIMHSPDFDLSQTNDLAVTADGGTLYTGGSNTVLRISGGVAALAAVQDYSDFRDGVPANAWSGAYGVTISPDGAVYFADPNFGGRVLKLSGGVVSVHMRD